MSPNEIKEWILVLSASVSMISVSIGIYITLGQYRLKLKEEDRKLREEERLVVKNRAEEERLALSTRADVDVRLFKSFTELMDLAMGRREHVLSEKAVEELFKMELISKNDFDEDFTKRQEGNRKISEYAVVILPVGRAGQQAAIAAISTLAKSYPVLKTAAIEGLKSMQSYEVAQQYLQDLQRE